MRTTDSPGAAPARRRSCPDVRHVRRRALVLAVTALAGCFWGDGVGPAADPVEIVERVLPPALTGASYAVSLTASGGDGATYSWRVIAGSLPGGLTLAAGGRLQGAPTSAGTASFTVRASSGGRSAELDLELPVVADAPASFQITTFPVLPVPASIRPHLDAAVARWESAITGDLASVAIPEGLFEDDECEGFGALANGGAADDLLVLVSIDTIDGRSGVLGQAGPCGIRASGELPFLGSLFLDVVDLEPLAGTEALTFLIAHELGHVLGFGALWDRFELVDRTGSVPTLTGAAAVAEWQALGGTGDPPLENDGGVGTAEYHWEESVFDLELMTAFGEPVGTPQPLSRVTIASLADLGYTVDLSAADPYSLASLHVLERTRSRPAAPRLEGRDVVVSGPLRVLPRSGWGRLESAAGRGVRPPG